MARARKRSFKTREAYRHSRCWSSCFRRRATRISIVDMFIYLSRGPGISRRRSRLAATRSFQTRQATIYWLPPRCSTSRALNISHQLLEYFYLIFRLPQFDLRLGSESSRSCISPYSSVRHPRVHFRQLHSKRETEALMKTEVEMPCPNL